jgi:hypothetical protein
MSTVLDSRPAAPNATPAHSPRRSTFADALRAERIKLTSVRSTWITLVVTVALGVGVGTLISYLAGSHYASGGFRNTTWDPAGISLRAFSIAQLAIAVLGVLVITSEYGSGLIQVSLAAVPKRGVTPPRRRPRTRTGRGTPFVYQMFAVRSSQVRTLVHWRSVASPATAAAVRGWLASIGGSVWEGSGSVRRRA